MSAQCAMGSRGPLAAGVDAVAGEVGQQSVEVLRVSDVVVAAQQDGAGELAHERASQYAFEGSAAAGDVGGHRRSSLARAFGSSSRQHAR